MSITMGLILYFTLAFGLAIQFGVTARLFKRAAYQTRLLIQTERTMSTTQNDVTRLSDDVKANAAAIAAVGTLVHAQTQIIADLKAAGIPGIATLLDQLEANNATAAALVPPPAAPVAAATA